VTLAGHLLQSTLFAAVAGLATLALRKNHARTRHWLWLAASLKFLVPFSFLVAMGIEVEWRTAPANPPPQVSIVMEDATLPAVSLPAQVTEPPAPAPAHWKSTLLLVVWGAGTLAILLRWGMRWRRAASILRQAHVIGRVSGVPLLHCPAAMEPGVFGIFRPVLLMPAGVASRLSDAELQAVLAHELCHVRHRDNLAAAIHMLVEALFWFHPLVWWIGARLVEERELACDEEVLHRGNDPEVYAASILTVCYLCLESPLPCVSGITGADLQRRIETIMTPRVVRRLDFGRKLLLASLGAAAISGPLVIGLVQAQRGHAQERVVAPVAFEVASVKPLPEPKNWPWPDGFSTRPKRVGGRITWVTSAKDLLYYAFHVQRWQTNFPAELQYFYAIDAKTEESATDEQIRLMFKTMLKDRFKLAAHREVKEVNGYVLVAARGGTKIKEYKDSDEIAPMPDYLSMKPRNAWEHQVFITAGGKGYSALTGRRVSIDQLAECLQTEVETFVLNKTGMPGNYYFGTKFVNNRLPDVDGPSLFAALQEALGLRLEKQKGPVEMLIVDHMEKVPTEN